MNGGGGGGAGGSILIRGQVISVGNNLIGAPGGAGNPGNRAGYYGGAGGDGRIRVEYCDTPLSGYTNPPARTQKLNCYISEQIESTPYNQGRLNLPENVISSKTYKVQYGRKLNFSTVSSQLTYLRVPAGMFNTVALDALVGGLSSNTSLSIDVGNDGSVDWSATVGNASTTTNGNLAYAFNTYWSSHGASSTGTIDVPISVTLGGAGQVLLTNLQTQMSSSMLRSIRLNAQPYSSVLVNYTVGGSGSGPMTIAADVGDKGNIDWTWTGNVAFPDTANSGDLVTATITYLSGKSGDVDVPIRFYVSPATATLTLNNYTATPSQLPDAVIAAPNVVFSTPNIVEADNVTVALTISNTGGSKLNGLIASLSGIVPGGGLTYIGSALVPVISVNGTATVAIPWNTLGYTGTVPVRVTLDPYNRVSESNKANNVVSTTVSILSRPMLDVVSFTLSDDEPVVGEPVTVTLVLQNLGQTAAISQTTALYQGNPDAGALAINNRVSPALPGGMTTTLALTWVPTTTGTFRLFARADKDHRVNQPDRSLNDSWLDVFVGMRGPVLINSGTANDIPYIPTTGYGYVDVGTPDITLSCGIQPYQSVRSDPGGRIVYKFDNLQLHHFYHLDITLFECDGAGRQESVSVNGNQVAGPEYLSDGLVHRLSVRLDPALYSNRFISVTVSAPGIDGAIVNQVNLYDVDYRYADSGGASDPQYPSSEINRLGTYGWMTDTFSTANTAWGSLPYQSVRTSQGLNNNAVRYRFDGLNAAKLYQLELTLWQMTGTARIQKVQIDGVDTGIVVNTSDYQVHQLSFSVPITTYSSDGSIIGSIVRTNGGTGAFVNEIALEELTAVLPPVPGFTATPTSGYTPLGVQFSDQSSGLITSRTWDFGDNHTDTVANPFHIYNSVGGFTVTLTTTGPGGTTALSITNYITVSTVPSNITVMRVTPASSSVAAGAPVTIGIELSNVNNLGSFQFTLGYNPALVEVQAVTLGDFAGSTGRSVYPTGPVISNTAGTVIYGAASLGSGIPGPSGKGTIALVRLLPHGSGTAILHLSAVSASDITPNAINVTPQDGTLNIAACLGDFNGNGVVDIFDVQRVAYRWNTKVGDPLYDPLYDLDNNGQINILDVQIVASRWNIRCAVMQRPAPVVPAIAASQSVTLSLQPLSRTVLAGQLFTVTVAISNVSDLGAFDFSLGYSPSVVTVVTATLAGFPSSTGRQVYETGPNIDGVNGTLALGSFSLGATPAGPNGDGALAVVTLRAETSSPSGLTLLTANVSDHAANPESTILLSGSVMVATTKFIYVPMITR